MSNLKKPTSPEKKVEKPKSAAKTASTTEALLKEIRARQSSDSAN